MNNDNPIDPYELKADAASIRSGIYPGSTYHLNNALADVLILLTHTVEYLVDTAQSLQNRSTDGTTITFEVDGRKLAQAVVEHTLASFILSNPYANCHTQEDQANSHQAQDNREA